ncbi:MAG: GNAT family N-acetyltransferase [Bacteroidales bacterium]
MDTYTHNPELNRFEMLVDNHLAYVEYHIEPPYIDIIHTIVPKEIEGRGIAAQLVAATYRYGEQEHLQAKASCSYAKVWLQRHPSAS